MAGSFPLPDGFRTSCAPAAAPACAAVAATSPSHPGARSACDGGARSGTCAARSPPEWPTCSSEQLGGVGRFQNATLPRGHAKTSADQKRVVQRVEEGARLSLIMLLSPAMAQQGVKYLSCRVPYPRDRACEPIYMRACYTIFIRGRM
eukprot:scaffold788_cov231-Pinguiococcus_pyrenoidosus.AAC.19